MHTDKMLHFLCFCELATVGPVVDIEVHALVCVLFLSCRILPAVHTK